MMLPDLLSDAGPSLSALLLDMALKGLLILSLTAGLMFLLRRTAATVRHAVWAVALGSLLLVPVLSLTLPAWYLPILPAQFPVAVTVDAPAPASPGIAVDPPLRLPPAVTAPVTAPRAAVVPTVPALPAAPKGTAPTLEQRAGQALLAARGAWVGFKGRVAALQNWWTTYPDAQYLVVLMVWLAGVATVLLRLFFGLLGIAWIEWRSRPVKDHAWLALLDGISARYGLKRPVQLRKSYNVRMPVTWGFLRPVVLLPADADTWTEERRRVVLLHELAHIKRRDWLTQCMAQCACALHWFNPLAWVALQQLRREHELACDDEVLLSGLKPSTYAGHLLDLARTFWTARLSAPAALAVARRSAFEDRMEAILDPKRRRKALTRAIWIGTASLVSFALIPLAAMQLDRAAPASAPQVGQAMSLMQPVVVAPVVPPAPAPVPLLEGTDEVCKEVKETHALNRDGELMLDNINGAVYISTWDRSEVRIEAIACAYSKQRLDELDIVIEASAKTVRVETKYDEADWSARPTPRERKPAWVNYTLMVPAYAELASISLVNGDLHLRDLTGSVQAQTVNGTLHAQDLSGEADLSTVNGKLEARFAALNPSATINLSTVNGVVDLTLPNDANADISAGTLSGSIRNSYGLRLEDGRSVGSSIGGRIGRGGANFHLESVNGRIHIQRADGKDLGMEVYGQDRERYIYRAQREARNIVRDRAHAQADVAREHAHALREVERQEREVQRQLEQAERNLLRALERAETRDMSGMSRSERNAYRADLKAKHKLIKAELKAERKRIKAEMRAHRKALENDVDWEYQNNEWENENDNQWENDNENDQDLSHAGHNHTDAECELEASAVAFAELATSLGTAASEVGLNAARTALADLEDHLADLNLDLTVQTGEAAWHFNLEGEDLEAVGRWLDKSVSHMVASTLDAVDTAQLQADVGRATNEALHEAQMEMLNALADLPNEVGIPHLERLARTHPNASVRRAAKALLQDR